MGRKKKQPIEAVVLKTDTIAEGVQPINYMGEVSVKLMHGKRCIKDLKYHNAGMPNLFKFLANCLAGNFSDSLRPCKIVLFYYSDAEKSNATSPSQFVWTTEFGKDTLSNVTPYIMYDTTPQVRKVTETGNETSKANTEDGSHYSTTFHFRVPFAYINNTIIHAVAFYPANTVSYGDCSAYYLFTDEEGKTWKPIEVDDTTGNFSIIIDWTMSLMNKN